jgi:hypothetical protein
MDLNGVTSPSFARTRRLRTAVRAGRRRPGARVLPASALRFIPAAKHPIDAICQISRPSPLIPRCGSVERNGQGLPTLMIAQCF